MDVGLIGLPRSGKTTVFNLLTGAGISTNPYGGEKLSHNALMPIPDERLDLLSAMYHPKKTTPALLKVVDVPGLSQRDTGGANRFLNDVRLVDALVHVVRGFSSDVDGPPHPAQDIEDMELELTLADMDLLEKRAQRIRTAKKPTRELQEELALVERLLAAMEDGQRLTQVDLNPEEQRELSGYQFLTQKPMLCVLNLDDQTFQSRVYPDQQAVFDWALAKSTLVVPMAGQMEAEIKGLSEEDRLAFMQDLGIEEVGSARVAQAVYEKLGLISFLTAGEDEVRAWTIAKGCQAKTAAGKIHSDIERGFIRAEVVAYADLCRQGSMVKAREAGLVRLEGKEYEMQDGDVVNFRFNV